MAINFPDSPAPNDTFSINGRRYIWDGFKWGGGLVTTAVTISSNTAPTTPVINDLWWNTDEGALYVYYNDGNTSQWVSAAPPGIDGTNSVVSVNSPLTYDSVNKIIGMSGTPVMNGGASVVGIGAIANSTSQLAITDTVLAASGSLNGNALNIFQKWATTGNPTAILLNANNVSSGSTTKLIDLQVDGVTKFNVSKFGTLNLGTINSYETSRFYANKFIINPDGNDRLCFDGDLTINKDGFFGISRYHQSDTTAADVKLYRDPVQGGVFGTFGGALALRNGVFTQTQRWYNTFTDQSNFERVSVSFNKPTTAVFTGSVSNGVIGITGTILNVTAITSGVIATGMALNPGATGTISGYIPSATFIGTIANNRTLTTSSANGTITVGQIISGSGVTAGTIILSGSGSNWNISSSGNVTSVFITATGGTGAIGTYYVNTSQIVPTGNTITGTRYSDIPYAVLAAESSGTGAPNIGIVLSPKGTGSITAQVPDGTVAGGNARGINSLDLQTVRYFASQVASGQYSIAIGIGNKVAGGNPNGGSAGIGWNNETSNLNGPSVGAMAIGSGCFCDGNATLAMGSGGRADVLGKFAYGFGQFSTNGDGQMSFLGYRGGTTDTNLTQLWLQGNPGNPGRIPASTTWAADIDIVARSAGGVDNAYLKRRLLIKRGLLAANTVIVAGPDVVGTDMFSANAADWSVSFTADTTNGALSLYVTGAAATNIRWVAKVSLVEVGYI